VLPTTDDRQTDGRQHIANVNVSSRSLKMTVTNFKLYSFRFKFTREVFLESVTNSAINATGRQQIPIINAYFLTFSLNLSMVAVWNRAD